MDRFLKSAAEDNTNTVKPNGRLRQTRIEHGSKVEVVEEIMQLSQVMNTSEERELPLLLRELDGRFISLELLEQTDIGKALVQLYRRTESDTTREQARQMLRKWKRTAVDGLRRRHKRVETFALATSFLHMGAAVSDYFTTPIDISDGYLDDADPFVVIHDACAKGKHHTASRYFKLGGDPNEKCFEEDDVYARDDTPMICAARGCPEAGIHGGTKKHLLTLQIVLLYGGDVNAFNKLHQTALYMSIARGHLNVAVWLIENGADVNIADSVGVSPLLVAARLGRVDLVALLLECKATIQAPARPNTCCVKFPSIAQELHTFQGPVQTLLLQSLPSLATPPPHPVATTIQPRHSVAAVALASALKDQLRSLPPRAPTTIAVTTTVPFRDPPFSSESTWSIVKPKAVLPAPLPPSSTTPTASNPPPKYRSGGKWVKKRECSGRVHVAEWEFVKTDFASDAERQAHDTMQQCQDMYRVIQMKQARAPGGQRRQIHTAPDSLSRRGIRAQPRPSTVPT
ncbi:hypothetical protein H257_03054 [Aphanomyces astaci]|uniref:TFIIS N-terminal domain-containing protein n=1 Tax=Aphanomyces astaci TaxID=112090 RepID=W4H0Y2_APHAT|nr:hypothetical protein H257_03054 [Aphanomyces astaci]ETV85241.1 hypothetical protein H257_03054 [Aphanomyces astaci]|eukprot:XP_009825259.1 hypothetical protein H257_03054 [Aphanomyces astaci]